MPVSVIIGGELAGGCGSRLRTSSRPDSVADGLLESCRAMARPSAARLVFTPILLSSLLAAAVPGQEPAPSPWCADFDVAVARARKENKDLLVNFTGSDWCGWCMKLDAEVFRKPAFLDAVRDRYVLVALDYPRQQPAIDKVPDPKRNAEVAGLYGVTGYPTVLLINPEGDVIATTGYVEGGAENYVAQLDSLAKEGHANLAPLREMQLRFEKAKQKERVEIVREAVAQLTQMSRDNFGVRGVAGIAKHALKLDKANKQGLAHAAIRAIVMAGVADAEVLDAARGDKKNKQGLYELLAADAVMKTTTEAQIAATVELVEQVAALGIRDRQIAAFVCTNAAIWCDEQLKDQERARAFARQALDAGTEQRARMQKIVGG